MGKVFIVIYRQKAGTRWALQTGGIFSDERLAKNFAECLESQFETLEHAVVSGIPVMIAPKPEAELEEA
jgi:hypothetical protein